MSTTNKQLEQPAFNAYPNTWGTGPLNSNFGYIDTALGGSTSLNATGLGGSIVPLTDDQARPLTLVISGTPGGVVTYEIPAGVGGQWIVRNLTTGGYDVRIRSASATGIFVAIPAGNNLQISCDGTASGVIRNTTAGVNAAAGLNTQVQYNSAGSLAGSNNLAFDGTTLYTAGLNNIGSTILGDASGDTLTIRGTAVAIPNGLNIGSNTLYLAQGAQQVGIGTTSLSSNTLTVAGVIQSTAGGIKFPDGTVQTTAGGGGGGGISSITMNTVNLPNITVGGSNIQTLTSNGTFLLGGTLAISNGGTGQTTASGAFTALAPSQSGANNKYLKSNGTVADWANLTLDNGVTVVNGVGVGNVLINNSGLLGNFALGSGVQTVLGVNLGAAGSMLTNGGALGTPISGNLANCTGVSLGSVTGILGLANGGTGANLSATGGASQVLRQSSAGAAVTVGQLAASDLSNGTTGSGAVALASGTTGSGNNVLATSPTLVTPNLGTPASGNLSNCTGFPGSGSNSNEAYLGTDVTITNGSSYTNVLQFTVPSTGTYYIMAFGQLNWQQGSSTDAQIYVDFGLGTSSGSNDLGTINLTVLNAFNVPGVFGTVKGLTSGQTVYLVTRYSAASGGAAYVRTGGVGGKGTKIVYTRVA